ncbi:hypothetical protein CRE_08318 [Caenorhabditis remanei]|uniref:SPK domain-containing protein n=1 Tax=Caenorhabditis remanei TaxID=31234 RepID=E3MPC9_CAERE|nr:hypothetical protein CRE_08318 [Caenorhabditis remanei]
MKKDMETRSMEKELEEKKLVDELKKAMDGKKKAQDSVNAFGKMDNEEINKLKTELKKKEDARKKQVMEMKKENELRDIVSTELEDDTNDHHIKVKLAVVLTSPISEDILQRIQSSTSIPLVIMRKLRKLKISNFQTSEKVMKQSDSEDLMMDLLSKLSDGLEMITNTYFIQKYKEVTKTIESERSIERAFSKVKQQIFQSTKYDLSRKVKMLYCSKARCDLDVFSELQKDGIVVLDGIKNSITSYTSNDGSLKLGPPIEDTKRRRKSNSKDSLDLRMSTMQVNDESDDESDNDSDSDNENTPASNEKPSCFWIESDETIGVKSVLQFISNLSRSILLPEGPQLTSMEEMLTEVEKIYRTQNEKKIRTSTILMLLYVELLKNVNSATTTSPTNNEFLSIEMYLKMFLDALRYIQSHEVERYRSGLTNTFSSFKGTKKMVPVVDVIETLRSVFKFVVDYLKSDKKDLSEKSKKSNKKPEH